MRVPAFPEFDLRIRPAAARRRAIGRPGSAVAPFLALPWLLQLGLLLFGLGLVGDLAYHLLSPAVGATLAQSVGLRADDPHRLIFAGMVVIVAGVLQRGVRHGR